MITSEYMKADVTEQGIVIPKEWLLGIDRVQISKKNKIIMIMPAIENDPILKLGTDPVSCEITNGSENHDEYLYGKF